MKLLTKEKWEMQEAKIHYNPVQRKGRESWN